MSVTAPPRFEFVSDLLEFLGDIPADRVRLVPPPGTATRDDLIAIQSRDDGRYELINGTIVRQPVGYNAHYLAGLIDWLLMNHVRAADVGIVTVHGPEQTYGLTPGDSWRFYTI